VSSVVVQTSFLGDVVLTTPLLAALAERGPVDVVVTPAGAPLLAGHPAIRTLLVYDKRGADRGVTGVWRMAARVRALGARAAYLAQASMRSAALVALAGVPERVGFATASGRPLYTRRVRPRPGAHHAERLWALAQADGAAPGARALQPRLHPGAREREAADAALGALAGGGFVALAPGSVWATKRWPEYAALARALAAERPVVVVGGPGDAEAAAAIVAACAGAAQPALDTTGRLSLLASAEVIGRAALLVTNDSSPQHLASAMATPTLTIFGPTVPAFGFGPLAPGSAVAEVDGLPCRPCDPHGPQRCPLGHWRCMRELGADVVLARARAMLAEGAARGPAVLPT
jgi:heptosyltransferase-2